MKDWLEFCAAAFMGAGLNYYFCTKKAVQPLQNTPLLLNSFRIYKREKDDTWNKKPGTEYHCKILAEDNTPNAKAGIKEIGHFDYRATVGQIGRLYLADGYRNRCLKEQILIYMMKDMLDHGATHIWEVCNEDMSRWSDETSYSKMWDFKYKADAVHPSVTGTGYIMPIPKDPRELVISIKEGRK